MTEDDGSADATPDSFLRAIAAVPAAKSENLEGQTLGRHRIGARLGAGGMGVVYRATDPSLRREVAIKVLPPELVGDPERRRRFLREARLAAALPHPNIAVVHEVGESDGRVFLVMELVEGRTLRARMDEGVVPPREAAHIARSIATGLAKAHAAGIVHRDLKPENVMLRVDGTVKILDFGIAKLRDTEIVSGDAATASALTTAEGRLIGTPAYMSPEQAKGRDVSDKSDVFSLGVVLYEMVTGMRPFRGATPVETLIAIDRDQPTPPSKHVPIPESLERVIASCLEKKPEKRPTVAGVASALEGLEKAERNRRIRRWSVVAIGLSVGVGAIAWGMRPPPAQDLRPDPIPAAQASAAVTPAASTPEPIADVVVIVPVVDAGVRRTTVLPNTKPTIVDAGIATPDLFHGLAIDAPF